MAPLDADHSLLEFYRRVLDESRDESHPVLERVKFLGILGTLLDEFVSTRCLDCSSQTSRWVLRTRRPQSGEVEAARLHSTLAALLASARACLDGQLLPALAHHGIHLLPYAMLQHKERAEVDASFVESILPLLMPLGFDAARPFPHIASRRITLAVIVREGTTERLAFVQLPHAAPRFVRFHRRLPESDCASNCCSIEQGFVWTDDAISANAAAVFPGTEIVSVYAFRIVRDERAEAIPPTTPIRDAIVTRLERREFGRVLAMSADARTPAWLLNLLTRHLDVARHALTTQQDIRDLSHLNELASLNRPELRHRPIVSRVPRQLVIDNAGSDIFSAIRSGDVLLHHPFESFSPVVDFFERAARDRDVLAISTTLYRTDRHSHVVESLVAARRAGKHVRAVVELRARSDEENNLSLARVLESSGAHVVYGTVDRKVHAKLTLVIRREHGRLRRYVHVSSGNYCSTTAGCYTDFAVLSCDDAIGSDSTQLFNMLTGYGAPPAFRTMLVAPLTLRRRVAELIEREAAWARRGRAASIVLKMNSLADPQIIGCLYRASQAGAQIDLIVRGICCLRPGVAGLSDNIRVRSVVGRFLEHSRAWYFANGGDAEVYVGSADLTAQNLDQRIEVMLRLDDSRLKRRVRDEVLATYLADNIKSRALTASGAYVRTPPLRDAALIDSQELLQ